MFLFKFNYTKATCKVYVKFKLEVNNRARNLCGAPFVFNMHGKLIIHRCAH